MGQKLFALLRQKNIKACLPQKCKEGFLMKILREINECLLKLAGWLVMIPAIAPMEAQLGIYVRQ
jgi:hypothetical protein